MYQTLQVLLPILVLLTVTKPLYWVNQYYYLVWFLDNLRLKQ